MMREKSRARRRVRTRVALFLSFASLAGLYLIRLLGAALHAAGVMTHRYTAKQHKPRGIFCAIGRCTDCVMIVNGQPNVRTCITMLEDGMEVQTQYGVETREAWEAKNK